MATKVLVFESDPAFAGELRTELGRLGLVAQVVDDGNAGLMAAASDRPDLILLSIELPRMNGFSVCNKLKKDATLKDVPLVIMSSESSEDTFEQHQHIKVLVPLAGGDDDRGSDGDIAIDDVDLVEEEPTAVGPAHKAPPLP